MYDAHTIVLSFLPSFCCFFWALMLISFFKKGRMVNTLITVALACGITFLCDAFFYMNGLCTPKETVILCGIEPITSLIQYPTVILFIMSLKQERDNKFLSGLMYLPALIMAAAEAVILFEMGFDDVYGQIRHEILGDAQAAVTPDRAKQILFSVTRIWFCVMAVTGMIACIVISTTELINRRFSIRMLFDFFKGNGKVPAYYIIYLPLVLILVTTMITSFAGNFTFWSTHNHARIAIYIWDTLLMFSFFYIASFLLNRDVTIAETRMHTALFDGKDEHHRERADTQQNELFQKFITYMETEKHFLDPEITIDTVKRNLLTNRTYISAMLKQEMNIPFRTYLNRLRIEEAKRLMMENPNEILDNIASGSGFASDSQLVKKFNEMEGKSPKIWLREMRSQKKNATGRQKKEKK